jgi:transposase
MLTWEDCVQAQALRNRGWSISAIAAHLGHDRKTVRAYLNGERRPGERARARVDAFEEFAGYCGRRLADDKHLWLTTLFDEIVELGYPGSYQAFTAAVRRRGLRPRCAQCAAARLRDRALIRHPPGEETRWDWVQLPNPPASWGWGPTAHVLVGALPHSGRWRGWLAERDDQPHLIEGLDRLTRRLGGVSGRWRFDRMSTVADPKTGRLQPSFGPVAMHYGVSVAVCPPGHGWRKGAVEKAIHTITQRWWRTVADGATIASAQASLDRVCARLDRRPRTRDGVRTTVGALAEREPLRPPPAPFPATIDVERTVRDQALVAFRGNLYSVPPGHAGEVVQVRHRLGEITLDVVTARGVLVAHHLRAPDGAGALVRLDEHVTALTRVVLDGFTSKQPCRRKDRRPPSTAALAEAQRIRRGRAGIAGEQVVFDLATYQAALRPAGAPEDGEAG